MRAQLLLFVVTAYSRSLSPAKHDSRFEFYLLEAFYAFFLMRNQRFFSLSLINCIALLFYVYNVVKIINYGFHSSFLLIIEEHLQLEYSIMCVAI